MNRSIANASPQAVVFAPGFRLTTIDVVILVVGAAAASALAMANWSWGFVTAFVLGHFFLFCNIFRVARSLELAWAGVFVALAAATIAFDTPGWLVTAAVSLAATVAVVVLELRKPSYHGAGWRRINPGLSAWWESRMRDVNQGN